MAHGGKRPGAGRKPGSGKYGCSTKVIRVPEDRVGDITNYLKSIASLKGDVEDIQAVSRLTACSLTLYQSKVSAGVPSPADEFVEGRLDLNNYLIPHPAATFFVRVSGDSMLNVGIFPDDILVVDRSLEAKPGKIIIAVLNSELTVKRLLQQRGRIILQPENEQYTPIVVQEDDDLQIWGVVTSVIHKL